MLQGNYSQDRETLIAECLPGLVSELRMIDVEHLVAFVTLQMFNHVADLVTSAAEHFFVPGFITLGQGCEVNVDWNSPPSVLLDFIMHLGWGRAYFSVDMGHAHANVRLNYFDAGLETDDPDVNTRRLSETIWHNCLRRERAPNHRTVW
jgi:hypothetical protein